jgi:putative hydrolase of the HAD superfamily
MIGRPSILLFDLGGVLVENTGFDELRRLRPGALSNADVRARWLASPSLRAFERGQISAGLFAEQFVKEWQLRIPPAAFLVEFERWPKGLFPGAEGLLHRLQSQYRVACLTNTNELHWSRRRELGLLFDHVFLSHELGLVKPDAEIFEYVIQHLEVEPHRIAFFDDSLQNVEVAARIGIQAHHVVGLCELGTALSRLGLRSEP